MPGNEFPYGQEFNPVGGEFNETYISNVQGQRGSFKQEDLQNNSVQEIEQASTVPAGEATSDAISGNATSSISSTPVTSGATAAGGTATTTTIATTTGVVATGGVVIGAIIIAAAAANVFGHDFSLSIEPMTRSINYDLIVEFQTDNKLYVSIVDDRKQEVALNTHDLTVNDAYVEEGKLFYDVNGSFSGLETDVNYKLEAYAFDASGVRFEVYTSETSFVVPYTPVTGVSNFQYKENPVEQIIEFSFDVSIEEETTIYAHLLDENGDEVVLEEFPVRKGNNDAASIDPSITTIYGSFSDISAGIDYIFEAYGYASDGSVFTIYRHDEPLRLGSIGVQFVDGFEYSYDVYNKKALLFYSIGMINDDTVNVRVLDENGTIYGTATNEVKLEDASQDGDIYYYQVETEITGLQAGIDYYFEVYVTDSENNEAILYRTEAPSHMASTNIISISDPTYSGNGYLKTLDYQFTIGVVGDDVIYVNATNIATGSSTRTNQHEITYDSNSDDNEQYYTITGTLNNIAPGEDYTFEVSANDSDKESFVFYIEDGVLIPSIPIENISNFATAYDEIEKIITYEFDVITSEGHSVYVQLENEQRQQLNINEHYATPTTSATTNYTHLNGAFENLDLETPYYFSIYAYDEDDNRIDLFASEEPVEIPTPTFGVTELIINADPARKAIRVNASLYYNEDNFGKTALIELLDSNEEPVNGSARLIALSPEEALDNEHVRSDGALYYYNDGYTFVELTSGETYTVVISYLDEEGNPTAPDKVVLKQQEVLLETSDEYLPYISLISYEADTMEQIVNIYYDYRPNEVTYDHFDVLVENINGTDTLSDEYQDVGDGPADNGNAVVISMEGSSGYSYSIKLYGVDSLGNRTLLIQHAIYY